MIKSIGKLIYNPKSHLGINKRWLILMCDDEISRYYRHLYSKQYPYLNQGKSVKLIRPIWGTHISVIRGEKIPNIKSWLLDANKTVEFEYEPGILDNGEYYWLRVKCLYLSNLRSIYGLCQNPQFGFHLTIGRVAE